MTHSPQQLANIRSLWQVKVYDANSPCDVYHFENKQDLMASIHTTWSKMMDTINIIDDEKNQVVIVRRRTDDTVHLIAKAMHIRNFIDRPTHF